MFRSLSDRTVLHNGVSLPWLGIALRRPSGPRALRQTVDAAIDAGVRGFEVDMDDGGAVDFGAALRASGLPRREFFISLRVNGGEYGYAQTRESFDRAQEHLGLGHLDLMLLNRPSVARFPDAWQALEELSSEGRVRALGVVDCGISELREMLARASLRPTINQVAAYPALGQRALSQFCASENIQLRAASPLSGGRILRHPTIAAVAQDHGRTAAQVALRGLLQRDLPSVTATADPAHIREIVGVFDVHLTPEDLARLGQIHASPVAESAAGNTRAARWAGLLGGGRKVAVATAA